MKIRLSAEVPFYIALALQIFYVLRIITINSYENSSVYVFLILVFSLIAIVGSGYSRREYTILLILLGCSLLHMLAADDTNLLRIVLLVFSGKRVSRERLKKCLAIMYPATMLIVYYLSTIGVAGDVLKTGVWRVTAGFETRYSLGFDGPTRMMFVWVCCIASLLLYLNKTDWKRDIILLVISLYLFRISISYTGLYCSIMMLIMPYILNFFVRQGFGFLLKYAVNAALIVVLTLTVIASAFDISKTTLGIFINGRTYSLYYLFRHGIYPTLFGGPLPEGIKGLDNSYFYNMYLLGVIPTVIMIYAIWRLGVIVYKNNDVMGSASVVTFVFIAYVTQTFEYPFMNYFLFLIIENWKQFMNPGLIVREKKPSRSRHPLKIHKSVLGRL